MIPEIEISYPPTMSEAKISEATTTIRLAKTARREKYFLTVRLCAGVAVGAVMNYSELLRRWLTAKSVSNVLVRLSVGLDTFAGVEERVQIDDLILSHERYIVPCFLSIEQVLGRREVFSCFNRRVTIHDDRPIRIGLSHRLRSHS